MTNEELAQAIQAGERDRLPELWEQVQGLAKYWANRYTRTVAANGGDTNGRELFDDLFQCGYIAMVAAVDSFDSSAGGTFSTWYAYYFRQEVYSLMGWRSVPDPKTGKYVTIRRDALGHAGSLDAQLGDEADSGCLGDVIPDPDSLQGFEEVEERIWHEELHTALETALGAIPEDQSRTLRRRFYEGKTLAAIAAADGIYPETARQLESKGLRELRKPTIKKQLRGFIEQHTPYWAHVGPTAFNSTQTSAVELAVLRREDLEAKGFA